MSEIVVITKEELRNLIEDVVKTCLSSSIPKEEPTDIICIDEALNFLNKMGYPTTKNKIYKMTYTGQVPYGKYGKKLIFSRKELASWVKSVTNRVRRYEDMFDH